MTDPTLTDFSEKTRITELARLAILDTPPEQGFDDAVALVRLVCDVPIALVSLVDRDRQWFKAASGVTLGETARDTSVCSLAIKQPDVARVHYPDMDSRSGQTIEAACSDGQVRRMACAKQRRPVLLVQGNVWASSGSMQRRVERGVWARRRRHSCPVTIPTRSRNPTMIDTRPSVRFSMFPSGMFCHGS